jgi:hypothetical protein
MNFILLGGYMPGLFGNGDKPMSEEEKKKRSKEAEKALKRKQEGKQDKGPTVVLPTAIKPRPAQ